MQTMNEFTMNEVNTFKSQEEDSTVHWKSAGRRRIATPFGTRWLAVDWRGWPEIAAVWLVVASSWSLVKVVGNGLVWLEFTVRIGLWVDAVKSSAPRIFLRRPFGIHSISALSLIWIQDSIQSFQCDSWMIVFHRIVLWLVCLRCGNKFNDAMDSTSKHCRHASMMS